MTSTTYQVTGLTCEHCARAVTSELSGVSGVSTVSVDLVPGGQSAVTVTSPAALRTRLVLCIALTVPVFVFAMGVRFPGSEWLSLALATPVATWGAWPFHRAAAVNARHGSATMDTLVSVGVTAAYLWSLYALAKGTGDTYLEVASVITALILLGRYFEGRSRRRSGDALRALLAL